MSDSPQTPQATKRKRKVHFLVRWYSRLNIWARIALWIVLLGPPLAFGAYKLLKPVYRSWKQANALKMAENFVEKGDYRAASLSFRNAIRANPKNPEAWKKIGVFLESVNSSDVVDVRERIWRLNPEDSGAYFQWLRSAIDAKRYFAVQEILSQAPTEWRTDARYYQAEGIMKAGYGRYDDAKAVLTKALDLDPNLDGALFQLNVLKLRSSNLVERQGAVEFLQGIAERPGPDGTQALRELVADAAARKDLLSAKVYIDKLVERDDATLRDRLIQMDLELTTQSSFAPLILDQLLDYAQAHPENILPLSEYLIGRGRLTEVRLWLERMPPEVASTEYVRAARFEAAIADRDWDDAFRILRDMKGENAIPPEMIADAEQAFSLEGQKSDDAMPMWQKALYATENSPTGLYTLVKLSRARGWEEAQLKALWALVERRPEIAEMWMEIIRMETARKNTNALYQALEGAMRANPGNLSVQSDFIILSVLLNKGDPRDLLGKATAIYNMAPDNPFFTVSYAMALNRAGDPAKACEIIEQLPPGEKNMPERALYRSEILASASRPEEARKALALAEPALDRMLPEENVLFLSVRSQLEGGKKLSREEIDAAVAKARASDAETAEMAKALKKERGEQEADGSSQQLLKEFQGQRSNRKDSEEETRALIDAIREIPADQKDGQ